MSALEVSDRFVLAYRDVNVTRGKIRSTIPAGSLVRADDACVKAHPELFFEPTRYSFSVDVREVSEEGHPLRSYTRTYTFDNLPPAAPQAADHWASYWLERFDAEGMRPRNVECVRTGDSAFIVRCEFGRSASEVVLIESTLSDGRVARSVRKSY